jgi:hypothetical protein
MRPSSGRPYPVVAFGRHQYEPAQGSAGHRLQPPTAIVRMPSTAMTPMAMLVRGHIRIWCCTLWCRRALLTRLGHRQILRHRNGRQCADNQGAVCKSDTHARLRVLFRSECRRYPSTHPPVGLAKSFLPRAWTTAPAAITTTPVQRRVSSIAAATSKVAMTSVVKMIRTPCRGQGQRQVQ